MSKDESISLRLSAIDCNTSTKYYKLTKKISKIEREKIKEYFKYYTANEFKNKENIAGNMNGWMCKDKDIEIIEKILNISETRKKQRDELKAVQEINNSTNMNNIIELNI